MKRVKRITLAMKREAARRGRSLAEVAETFTKRKVKVPIDPGWRLIATPEELDRLAERFPVKRKESS